MNDAGCFLYTGTVPLLNLLGLGEGLQLCSLRGFEGVPPEKLIKITVKVQYITGTDIGMRHAT